MPKEERRGQKKGWGDGWTDKWMEEINWSKLGSHHGESIFKLTVRLRIYQHRQQFQFLRMLACQKDAHYFLFLLPQKPLKFLKIKFLKVTEMQLTGSYWVPKGTTCTWPALISRCWIGLNENRRRKSIDLYNSHYNQSLCDWILAKSICYLHVDKWAQESTHSCEV